MRPVEVFGINATVVMDVTESGRHTNRIDVSTCSGDAVDRIQKASDYRFIERNLSLKDGVYTDGSVYLAYSFYPCRGDRVFLCTAKCSDPNLDHSASLIMVSKAMDKAIEHMNKCIDSFC